MRGPAHYDLNESPNGTGFDAGSLQDRWSFVTGEIGIVQQPDRHRGGRAGEFQVRDHAQYFPGRGLRTFR
jgi:hypothetical protein